MENKENRLTNFIIYITALEDKTNNQNLSLKGNNQEEGLEKGKELKNKINKITSK